MAARRGPPVLDSLSLSRTLSPFVHSCYIIRSYRSRAARMRRTQFCAPVSIDISSSRHANDAMHRDPVPITLLLLSLSAAFPATRGLSRFAFAEEETGAKEEEEQVSPLGTRNTYLSYTRCIHMPRVVMKILQTRIHTYTSAPAYMLHFHDETADVRRAFGVFFI